MPEAAARTGLEEPQTATGAMASIAEAHFGLGDKAQFESTMAQATELATALCIIETTEEQIGKLERFLAQS